MTRALQEEGATTASVETTRPDARARRCRAYLGIGVAMAVAHPLIVSPLASDIAYFLIAFYGLAGCVIGVRSNRPRDGIAWVWMLVAHALLTAGEVAQAATDNDGSFGRSVNLADLLYIAAYAMFVAALLGLARDPAGSRQRAGMLDGLIVFTGLTLVAWELLVLPTYTAGAAYAAPQLLRAFYPIVDLLLLGLLVWIATAREARSPAFLLLAAGFTAWACADALFHMTVSSVSEPSALLKSMWLLAHVLWGAALMHPSLHALHAPRDHETGDFPPGRLATLALATLIAPGVLLVQYAFGIPVDVAGVAVTSIIITALTWTRVRHLLARMRQQARRLSHWAQTDALTALPNRRQLEHRLSQAFADRENVALLALDVDRFKGVNDTFGHPVGDRMLCALAQRWGDELEAGDLLARLGGDEFGVLLRGPSAGKRAIECAWRLQASLAEPLALDGISLHAAASIGVATSPEDGTDAERLMRSASAAMRAAKQRQSRVEAFVDELDTQDSRRLLLLNEFHEAIRRGELVVHYQPKLALASGRVSGVEALVRWQHPREGLLPPSAFIGAVEQTEMARDLVQVVLDLALAQCAAWRREGLSLEVAVNLSPRNLADPDLADWVAGRLSANGLPAHALELEITESSAMGDPVRSLHALGALHALGVILSIDDYGTGHSSLAYLQQMPIRVLKLDRTFVSRMGRTMADDAIVRSTLELAAELGLDVVAEGVEDAHTLSLLAAMGCHAAQGYHLAPPQPPADIPQVIRDIERRMRRQVTAHE
ncbi:bifunctional diguanylate cyclase/phosphodiesterase [uncultured Pseudoxanthomonas sp.]|uniref:putative bifunctional diguanylate cyclase/phosphodiesterase n=1 Tax=uncultured Pseudoxanthomonas sp. TaxID=281701 RepID=UPI002609CE90|nr:bifunctional diguanylate cyclase/phosphodiesterase [uncultured Pseudoxanthomonas sp.]